MTEERLPSGTIVGERYVVDEFLARGGFASVYRAHHQQIGRRLAIKVLDFPRSGGPDGAFRDRFLTEAKIAARIEHPGVVSVFDFGLLDDGRAFIAMDLLDGHDLDTELRENGPIAAPRFIPMVIECLAALGEGHQQGIVHKDLKPSNLFIVRPGQRGERLVILDFGIARVFDDPGAHVTQEGGFSGTPAYLAPEYIRYQTVSPAMDVYQMGLILIESLTGAQAVKSESSMGYLLAHCLEPVRLPTVLLDTELGEICLRAVQKDPEHRFRNAEEFRTALLGVPRTDLFDTQKITFDRALPNEADQQLAKTMQFIHVSPEALEQLSGPLSAPPTTNTPSVPPNQPKRSPVVVFTALIILLIAVAAALFVVMSNVSTDETVAATTSEQPAPPVHHEPAAIIRPDLGVLPPPTLAVGAGPDLGGVVDASVPDLAVAPPAEVAAEKPRSKTPRPKRDPAPPRRDPKPAPLLLSP